MPDLSVLLGLLVVILLLVLFRLHQRHQRLQQRLDYVTLQHQKAQQFQPPSVAWNERHFDTCPLAVLVTDERRLLRAMNPAAEAIFGRGVPGEGLIKRVRHHMLEQLVTSTLAGQAARSELVELSDRRYVLARATRWQQRGDGERGALLVLQDVTEQHRLARSRRDMVENLSHELRTPLTSVRLLTDNLLQGAVERPEIAVRFVQRIAAENEAMIHLIEDLTTLSALDSGRMPLRLAPHDLRALVEERVQRLTPLAVEHAITFDLHAPPVVEVDIDRERIGQVLTNLLHNALKFSPEGGTITIQIMPEEGGVVVSVRDEGPGILATDLPRIFERFYKVSRARTRSSSAGTGLGLAIARHIAEGHGGTLKAESQYGHGATFTLTLPRD